MHFSPLYYEVQSIIQNDNIKLLKKIFDDKNKESELRDYFEDFLHCTYPKSFKSLHFLMQMNKRYSIHSAFSSAFKDDNIEWIDSYLSTLSTKKINNTDYTSQDIISKNSMVAEINFDYDSFINSSKDIWDIFFKYNNMLNLFKPHMVLNAIFDVDNPQLDKVYLLLELCDKNKIEFPIKECISKCFFHNELELADDLLKRLSPSFNQDDTTDLINSVGLSSNIDCFNFLNDKIFPLSEFNPEQKALIFNGGFVCQKTELSLFLIKNHNFKFYPDEISLKNLFIAHRNTMWEDNEYSNQLEFLNDLLPLIPHENLNDLVKEVDSFPNAKKTLNSILLNNKLSSSLNENLNQSKKNKI